MTLTRRLIVGAAGMVILLVALVLTVAGRRAERALLDLSTTQTLAMARLAASSWSAGAEPAEVATRVAAATGHEVTILDSLGVPVADGVRTRQELPDVPTIFPALPEVRGAAENGVGIDRVARATPSPEIRVAVKAPGGFVRVVSDVGELTGVMRRARRDVYLAGVAVLLVATLLALWTAELARRPLHELRDVTRALASGDLSRRPTLVAPGEIGDLGSAIYRLAELLTGRLNALKAEEGLLRATMESLNEGVIVVDEREQVVRINRTARQLLAAFEPTPFPAERLPRDRVLREALAAAFQGESTSGVEVSVLGHTLTVTARPLPDGGAVLAAYDLTRMRRLETVRRDFVANVSHELKTPLTVVSGFAETLAAEDTPPEVRRQFAHSIYTNARRMQRIVDDLLDLSRIESGGWKPRPVKTSVRAAAAEVFGTVAERAARDGTELTTEIEGDADLVWADPTALRQMLINLVENAVRHAPGGTVTVFVRRGDRESKLGVRDTGMGIGAEHLPRIFERFYRADAARSRDAGGTGLGLAIVKHLVEAHGGSVNAESLLGKGTTITATLPRPDES